MKEIAISVRQRTDGAGRKDLWGVYWRAPKKKSRYFPTEAAANDFKTQLLAALEAAQRKTPPPPPKPELKAGTVAAYLDSWLDLEVKPHREAATYQSYEGLVRNHIVPAPLTGKGWRGFGLQDRKTFGNLLMTDLRPKVIKRLYEDLYERDVSLATRRHVHTCLSSAFETGVTEEELDYNPCAKLGRKLRHEDEQDDDPEPNPFTPEEAALFLADIAKHAPDWLDYFQFAHDQGPRVGEIAALKWTNEDGEPLIDLKAKTAKIEQSYSPRSKRDKSTKTHQRRTLQLTDLVTEQLTAWRPRQRELALKRGWAERLTKHRYVFTLKNGSPRRQDGNMRRVFDRSMARLAGRETVAVRDYLKASDGTSVDAAIRAMRKAGTLPASFTVATYQSGAAWLAHTPHDIRDTFASTHLSQDWTKLPWVSGQLGHETTRTTEDHYFAYRPADEVAKGFANQIRKAK